MRGAAPSLSKRQKRPSQSATLFRILPKLPGDSFCEVHFDRAAASDLVRPLPAKEGLDVLARGRI